MESKSSSAVKRRQQLKSAGWIILGIICLILFSSIIYSGFTDRTTQLSAYSDKWNDLSKFRENTEDLGYQTVSILSSPTMLLEVEEPEKSLFVAIGVERAYSSTEARVIYDFIKKGGKAIIADDYGFANSLSEYYFDVTYMGHRLWDQEYDRNPTLVKIDVDPERHGDFYFDGTILFNNPTALESASGIIAASTNLSWVDENNDGLQNIEEMPRPYPVVVKKPVSDGLIIFISDSSLFINDMWDRSNNAEFIMALVQHLIDPGGTVIFDESRHIRDNPIDTGRQAVYEAMVILTTDDQLRWLTAIVTILIMGLLIIAYDNPHELKHSFNVGKFKLTELREPFLTYKDADRLRYVFLEKIRIHVGLSLDEFRDLTREELEELIADRSLSDFAMDFSRSYSGSELNMLFRRVKDWPMISEAIEPIILN